MFDAIPTDGRKEGAPEKDLIRLGRQVQLVASSRHTGQGRRLPGLGKRSEFPAAVPDGRHCEQTRPCAHHLVAVTMHTEPTAPQLAPGTYIR